MGLWISWISLAITPRYERAHANMAVLGAFFGCVRSAGARAFANKVTLRRPSPFRRRLVAKAPQLGGTGVPRR